MNDMLFRTLLKRYEAVIEDALYKIQSFNENNIIIPEHIDITGEIVIGEGTLDQAPMLYIG